MAGRRPGIRSDRYRDRMIVRSAPDPVTFRGDADLPGERGAFNCAS
jgi:hypothetical protein